MLSKAAFQKTILAWYRQNGRSLPWRKTRNPYRIWVSEVMLQQTQVDRVRPKYRAFLEAFPTVSALAAAQQSEVLRLWQGLGYNRRALQLKRGAEAVLEKHGGRVPSSVEDLEALPGIGPYTARAIAAFAFGQAHAFVETNIRAVYFHFFFRSHQAVTDKEVLEKVRKTLYVEDPRSWYYALMDYGADLKKRTRGLNAKSAHYAKQSAFAGSNRQVRGAIVALLAGRRKVPLFRLEESLPFGKERISTALRSLEKEGFIKEKAGFIEIV